MVEPDCAAMNTKTNQPTLKTFETVSWTDGSDGTGMSAMKRVDDSTLEQIADALHAAVRAGDIDTTYHCVWGMQG